MKKTILSITTFLLFMSTCLQAQPNNVFYQDDVCCEERSGFYAEIFGGANFLQEEKRNHHIKAEFNTGYIVSGSIGYLWCNGIRVEAEYAYRRNSLDKLRYHGKGYSFDGHFQTSSYMANALWELPMYRWNLNCWKLQPFVGGGIGYDHQQFLLKHQEFKIRGKNDDHFAWQVIAGVKYPLFCNTDISIEYKYHNGGTKHINDHSVGVGLTYNFSEYLTRFF